MGTLASVALLVLAADQLVKWLLRRTLSGRAARLGPFGTVELVHARIWLARAGTSRPRLILVVWLLAATSLLAVTAWTPAAMPWVGMLLGGSSSHALESAVRGSISDYICLRFWPAFNLADVAITVGAIGVIGTMAA